MDLSLELFIKLVYALGIGALIGLERSLVPSFYSQADDEKITRDSSTKILNKTRTYDDLIGVRTFSILSLGGFSAALIGTMNKPVAAVVIAGLLAMIVMMYTRTSHEDNGITTEIAAVVCCGLGMLCYTSSHTAGVIALFITVILSMKRFMERFIHNFKRIELTDTLKFLIVILVILPLLPDRTLDPYDVFNPYKITFLVILISGISFVGYFLTKFLGAEKGLGLTGLLGGLTSSTAVTAAMATQAKRAPGLQNACAFATIMPMRQCLEGFWLWFLSSIRIWF